MLQRQEAKAASFTAGLVERGGEKIELHTGVEAGAVQADLQGARWSVAGVQEQERQRHPDAPFTTSTLQQEASRKLGFSPRQTMAVAQQLYEGIAPFGGLITYMRTDSVNIAQEAQQRAREYIRTKLEKGMLPEQPRTYRTRSKLAQEAHEAIRPTDVFNEPDSRPGRRGGAHARPVPTVRPDLEAFPGVPDDLGRLRRHDRRGGRSGHVANRYYRFRATGSRLKFAGFLSLYRVGVDDEERPATRSASRCLR